MSSEQRPGVHLTNILCAAFMRKDPQSAKKDSQVKHLFCFHVKVVCKHIDEIDPAVKSGNYAGVIAGWSFYTGLTFIIFSLCSLHFCYLSHKFFFANAKTDIFIDMM